VRHYHNGCSAFAHWTCRKMTQVGRAQQKSKVRECDKKAEVASLRVSPKESSSWYDGEKLVERQRTISLFSHWRCDIACAKS